MLLMVLGVMAAGGWRRTLEAKQQGILLILLLQEQCQQLHLLLELQVSHGATAKKVAVVAGRNLQSAIHAQVCTSSKQLGLRSGHWRMQIGEGRGRHELLLVLLQHRTQKSRGGADAGQKGGGHGGDHALGRRR